MIQKKINHQNQLNHINPGSDNDKKLFQNRIAEFKKE